MKKNNKPWSVSLSNIKTTPTRFSGINALIESSLNFEDTVGQGEMSKQKEDKEFKVAIYANEYKQICAWVLKQEYLETGGDLFGLWASDHTAVIQIVLGPGKYCRRASASFYQDVDYLEKAGSQLIEKEGVCHIGEWHSHHRIGLKRPSGGDEGTVWRNVPRYGLNRFLLFIANIETRFISGVSIGCFLFERGAGNHVIQGQFHLLPNESPLRTKYLTALMEGSETINEQQEISLFTAETVERVFCSFRPVMCRISQNEGEPATSNENIIHSNSVQNALTRERKKCCPDCTML